MSSNLRLKNWIICSHADKELKVEEPHSKYDCKIQAGAACTDKRICPINDHDGFADSISIRNPRMSETTAMFWISKHIDSDYVGIAHYRRRFQLSEQELDTLLDGGIDFITSTQINIPFSFYKHYQRCCYIKDLDLLIDIVKKQYPSDLELLQREVNSTSFRKCNMNIFKADLFRDYSEWLFPLLDSFYNVCPVKTDNYMRRDVGFIAEFLTSVYISKLIDSGLKYREYPILEYSSADAIDDNSDINTQEALYDKCRLLFSQNNITKSFHLFLEKVLIDKVISSNNDQIGDLGVMYSIMEAERHSIPRTICDYLPLDFRSSLDEIVKMCSGLRNMIMIYSQSHSDEILSQLQRFLDLTGFSHVAVNTLLEQLGSPSDVQKALDSLNYKN